MSRLNQFLLNSAFVIVSLLVMAVLLVVAEFVVRATTSVGTLGTEREFFVNNAWLESVGNAPNSTAIAFGVEVYTDELGFRSSRVDAKQPVADHTILVLGDSVAFGVGVTFDKIAPTLIERALVSTKIVNSSVIGYSLSDYLNVTKVLLEKNLRPIDEIVLFICMNDVSEASARRIRKIVVHRETEKQMHRASMFSLSDDAFEELRHNPIVRQINDQLRARSHLYVLARGIITDPQRRHWEGVQKDYQQLSDHQLKEIFAPLTTLAELASVRDIQLSIGIVPYAEQMNGGEPRLPQDRIIEFLETQEIKHIDFLPVFLKTERPSKLFLPYDPVHLSIEGHQLVAQTMLEVLR